MPIYDIDRFRNHSLPIFIIIGYNNSEGSLTRVAVSDICGHLSQIFQHDDFEDFAVLSEVLFGSDIFFGEG